MLSASLWLSPSLHGVNRCVYGRDLAGLAKLLLSNRWAMPELVRVVRERFAS